MTSKKPILFSYFRSSCSFRVRIALALKNIDYEYKAVNLLKKEHLDPEYTKLNPLKQVPALVYDGNTMTQSLSILEFLEEVSPAVPLLPKCPVKRAKVREISELIGSGIQPLQNLSVLQQLEEERRMQWGHDVIHKGFVALEKILSQCSGKYSVGDVVTMADCCLVPQVFNADRFKVDMKPFPIIKRVHENLMEINAFILAQPNKQPDCPPGLEC